MLGRFTDAVRRALDGTTAPLVVAIDRPSGTRKRTLADHATRVLDAAVIGVNTFFGGGGDNAYWRTRTVQQRNAEVIDRQRLRAEALEPLRSGRAARWRPFDYVGPSRRLSGFARRPRLQPPR